MEPTIKTTNKVVKIEPEAKAAPKKTGRPRKMQDFTATEISQVATKLRPLQKLIKGKFGFEPTLLQTLDFAIHMAMPDDD